MQKKMVKQVKYSMKTYSNKWDRSFFSLLLIVLFWMGKISFTQSISSNAAYVEFFTYLLVYLLLSIRLKIHKKNVLMFSFVPLLIWFYGMVLGLLNGNNPEYIFRNFAGLVLYLFLFLIFDLDMKKRLEKLLLDLSVMSGILTIVGYYLAIRLQLSFMYTIPIINNFQPGLGILYGNCNFMYISYLYGLYKIFIEKKIKIKYLLLTIICPYASFLCMDVSAFPLACLVFFGIMFLLAIQKHKLNKKIKTTLVLIVLVACIALPIIYSNFFAIGADDGNSKRWAQIEYVFENFKVLGHGLGAEYPKGIGSIYAIEVIFLDIFYKFGVFALIIIWGYIYTLVKSIKHILSSRQNAYATIPLACMGYLFFALSNPVLFAPNSVVLHCCSLYLLKKAEEGNSNKNTIDLAVKKQ